jgi:hypothetical protein
MQCLLLPSAENEPHRKPLKPNSNHATKEGFAPPLAHSNAKRPLIPTDGGQDSN